MTLRIAYFQPTVIALDTVPPVEFSKIFQLVEEMHSHPELNDSGNPFISIRGGQQIQVYPNDLNLDVSWLIKWLETISQGYMDIVTAQSGQEDFKFCKPQVVSVWTIKQQQGDYQELHNHPGGNLSGNIYITVPDLASDSAPSDANLQFKLPQTRDVTKFIMQDHWKMKPVAGNVILFPSHLSHTVYPWKGEGHRTVMAFDVRVVPKDGVV